MNQPNHHDYYLRRAETSRVLAERAADSTIAAIHFEMASRYDDLVAQLERKTGVTETVLRQLGASGGADSSRRILQFARA